jgi:hypothetical protein
MKSLLTFSNGKSFPSAFRTLGVGYIQNVIVCRMNTCRRQLVIHMNEILILAYIFLLSPAVKKCEG